MFDGFSWFQSPGRTPTLSDLDRKPFFRRHFWPPSALGIIVISLVMSMLVGFLGAVVYTSSDNAKIAAVDPTDAEHIAPTIPQANEAALSTTTTLPQILTADGVAKKAAPSVWSVASLDDAGRPIEGSGFVAGSFGGQTYLLTSLSIVRAATRIPGPDITVSNGGSQLKATLWTWQEERDLALLVIGRSAPSLSWADQTPPPKAGDKVYLVGGAGGAAVPGVISAISPANIQHNIFTDPGRQGAPLLNEKGQILGMASLSFNPGATNSDTAFYAVPIAAACERVLSCGTGNNSVPSTVPGDSTTASSTVGSSSSTTTTTTHR
ncbi:MAG TPA: serine protease [Acidimicrobiales bacterium]|jgi:S1-C subfamily serine protease|nr:serine protease [Acidimicrobiales bacterium]